MSKTSIEWTTDTWNPIRARRLDTGKIGWHCEKISTGCANCYSETFNGRMLPNGGTGLDYKQRHREKIESYVDEGVLHEPLRWRKRRMVFVCSMTDLFGEWITDEMIDRVFAVMTLAPQHTFQVLTKRAERMRRYITGDGHRQHWNARGDSLDFTGIEARRSDIRCAMTSTDLDGYNRVGGLRWPSPNVWLGCSVENQETADERIPHLLQTPAAVSFLSVEPLLEAVDLGLSGGRCLQCKGRMFASVSPHSTCVRPGCIARGVRTANVSYKRPDWIICGGESGPRWRPMKLNWLESIADQCTATGTALFVKQDCGPRPGTQGRIPDDLWTRREFPAVAADPTPLERHGQ